MPQQYSNVFDHKSTSDILLQILRVQQQDGYFWIKAESWRPRINKKVWMHVTHEKRLAGFVEKRQHCRLTFSPIIFSEPKQKVELALPSRWRFNIGYANHIPREQGGLDDGHPPGIVVFDGARGGVSFLYEQARQPTKEDVSLIVPVPRGIDRGGTFSVPKRAAEASQ